MSYRRTIGVLILLAVAVGCEPTSRQGAARDTLDKKSPAPRKERSPIVIRAKYYQTEAPCVDLDENTRGRPITDAFEVEEVLAGSLKVKIVITRPFSHSGKAYPANLKVGNTYVLRLIPSSETAKQIQERGPKGFVFLWVDKEELAQHKPEAQPATALHL